MISEIFKRTNILVMLFVSLTLFVCFFSVEKDFFWSRQGIVLLDSIQEAAATLHAMDNNATIQLSTNLTGDMWSDNERIYILVQGKEFSREKSFYVQQGHFDKRIVVEKSGQVFVHG